MAGLGHKVWTQETVSVANVQGYLQDQTVEKFASAAARTAALPSPTEGMVSYLADVDRLDWYNGTTWSPVLPRGVARYTAPGTSISAGGGNETGSGGITALSNFTLYRPAVILATYTFRASGSGALASCAAKIDGATVGDVILSRTDEHVSGHGVITLAAGLHTCALRVDAASATVYWTTGRLTMQELMAE